MREGGATEMRDVLPPQTKEEERSKTCCPKKKVPYPSYWGEKSLEEGEIRSSGETHLKTTPCEKRNGMREAKEEGSYLPPVDPHGLEEGIR